MRTLRHIAVLTALFTLGCPGFETEFSGTYHQAVIPDVEPGGQPPELVAVDVFRYGDTVQTIVRFYERTPGMEPYEEEDRCFESDPVQLDEDLNFEVQFNDGLTRTRVEGRFTEEQEMLARFDTINDNEDILFERVEAQPSRQCDTIEPKQMVADFSGRSRANEFEEGVYEIHDPHFGIQWVSVSIREDNDILNFVPQSPPPLTAPVSSRMTDNHRGLQGSLALLLEPPPEQHRAVSGTTTYSLAHFMVLDDDPDDEGEFAWDDKTEPIIAAGVRPGTRPDPPILQGKKVDHNVFGKAVFFVSGSLTALDEGLKSKILNLDEIPPDAHFYIADVFAIDTRVKAMRLEDERAEEIQVIVTDGWLDETSNPLPRVFPK